MTDTKSKPRPSAAGQFRLYQDRASRTAAYDKPPPAEVLEERDRAYAAVDELPPGEAHLGSPPLCRSALPQREARPERQFSAAFLLIAGGER